MNHKSIYTSIASPATAGKLADFKLLIKFRLTMLVVLSALLAYVIVADEGFTLTAFLVLGLGGFCITAAANALNQAIEKDPDKLMRRTANRPVAMGRMSVNEAMIIAGLLFVLGIFLLASFNPLSAVLGAIAVVSYAFVYTPLKRVTPLSVLVGAIPGALPTMIAVVAVDGAITPMAIVLFGIQFFWQFPHFWSIGYLGFEDYKKAGFKLVPEQHGKVHPGLGWQSAVFALLLVPFSVTPYFLGAVHLPACLIVLVLTLAYAWSGWNMQRHTGIKSARLLMFASFLYLPVVLLTYYLGTF